MLVKWAPGDDILCRQAINSRGIDYAGLACLSLPLGFQLFDISVSENVRKWNYIFMFPQTNSARKAKG